MSLTEDAAMIHVIASIQAQPGQRDALLAEFNKLMPLVRAEEGCIEYGPAVDVDAGISVQNLTGDDQLTIIEKWESLEHLKAHLAAPHMADYRVAIRDVVAGVSLNILEPA